MNLVGRYSLKGGDFSELANQIGTVAAEAGGLRCNPVTTAVGYGIKRALSATGEAADFNLATVWLSDEFIVTTLPASGSEEIIVETDSSNGYKCAFRVTSTGKLQFYAADGTTQLGTDSTFTLVAGTKYRLARRIETGASVAWQWKLFNTASNLIGDPILELDGQSGTGANLNTNNFARGRIGKVTNRNGQSVSYLFSNAFVSDSGWVEYIQSAVGLANANGSTMSWVDGTAADYTAVADVSDATYVQSPTTGNPNVALFNFQSATEMGIPANARFDAVKLVTRSAEASAVTSSCLQRIRSGSTNSDGTALNQGTTVLNRGLMLAADPATSAAWTRAAIDAVEGGLVEANAVAQRCHLAQIVVFYVPTPLKLIEAVGASDDHASMTAAKAAWPNFAEVNQQIDYWLSAEVFDEKIDIAAGYRTSNAYCYPEFTAVGAARAFTPGTGARLIYSSNLGDGEDVWFCRMEYVRLSWFEISYTGAPTGGAPDASSSACKNNANGIKVRNMLIHDIEISARTRGLSAITGTDVEFDNNRIWGIRGITDASGLKLETPINGACSAKNNTVSDVIATSGNGWAYDFNTLATSTLTSRNNVGLRSDICFFDQGDTGGTIVQTNCASDDGTAVDFGGSNPLHTIVAADQFVDPDIPLVLKRTADLRGAGMDLGDVPAKYDCYGRDRHNEGDTWDIGAEQYVVRDTLTQPDPTDAAGLATSSMVSDWPGTKQITHRIAGVPVATFEVEVA